VEELVRDDGGRGEHVLVVLMEDLVREGGSAALSTSAPRTEELDRDDVDHGKLVEEVVRDGGVRGERPSMGEQGRSGHQPRRRP
jgi:hypothetical protein